MYKKFLLTSFFLVCTVLTSAEIRTDRKFLKELSCFSLVRFRCSPYGQFWKLYFGNSNRQHVNDGELCDDLNVLFGYSAVAGYNLQKEKYVSSDGKSSNKNVSGFERPIEGIIKELLKDKQPAVVEAECAGAKEVIQRLRQYGPRKK